jgi:hypothetical protein
MQVKLRALGRTQCLHHRSCRCLPARALRPAGPRNTRPDARAEAARSVAPRGTRLPRFVPGMSSGMSARMMSCVNGTRSPWHPAERHVPLLRGAGAPSGSLLAEPFAAGPSHTTGKRSSGCGGPIRPSERGLRQDTEMNVPWIHLPTSHPAAAMAPDPASKRTPSSKRRWLPAAAHVER